MLIPKIEKDKGYKRRENNKFDGFIVSWFFTFEADTFLFGGFISKRFFFRNISVAWNKNTEVRSVKSTYSMEKNYGQPSAFAYLRFAFLQILFKGLSSKIIVIFLHLRNKYLNDRNIEKKINFFFKRFRKK